MYKFALVGCGRISDKHVESLKVLENEGEARLVACCDVVRERADKIATTAGCKAYYSYEEMLKESDCDVVSICTPSGLHPRHTIMAARAGKHVLSEKPSGTKLSEVDKAIDVCDELGVKYFVVKQNRFNKTVQLLKKALDIGRFGRIYMLISNVLWTRPQEYYDMAPWRGAWEFDGGCLCNQAAHYVDLMQWLGGAVESVQAFSATLARRIEAEDTIVVNLRYRSGALGSINVTTLTYPKNLEGSITVIGEKGTVKIGGIALNKIDTWVFEESHPMDEEIQRANTNPTSVYGFGHLDFYRCVIESLKGGMRVNGVVEGREGRKTVEIIEAAYQSALSGGQVKPCAMPR
ncbi:MAG: UDP-N-acetyl-2-amino-2-deoxyglucuronate dehydrogenase [Clostridia bacterium]|nr:UDP-N-acetyl-2-amino-2-deoxyglucuronate dehydrogenase [Clostridia bacterium]